MKAISSRDNPLYKELKRLAGSSQERRDSGRTILDGIHLCQAYLQCAGMPLDCVASEADLRHPEVEPLLARCQAGRARCIVLPDALYRAIGQVESGVGVSFVIEVPRPALPAALDGAAVLLDRVQDPGNLGSIIRTAAAAGIESVFCGSGSAAPWAPKVLRAGMGAHFLLTVHEDADLRALLAGARIPVLATSPRAPRGLYECDLRGPVAWLFGHEGQGVADELLALASEQVSIPQPGGVESLNIGASAAICLFEQVRQRLG
jgi:TrmH family RNA methyltransferase